MLDHCTLGGQRQVLEQSTQVTAATQDLVAFIFLLGLAAQRVHQLLPHCDDQLAVGDVDLGGLAAAEAAGKGPDGLEECSEIEPAVLRQADLPPGVVLTGRWRDESGRTLEKRKEKIHKDQSRQASGMLAVFPLLSRLNLQEPV